MPEFNIRSDSVDVEQIMEQIRARIREKRGVDYTEQQIRELAAVKLEKFLDPRGVRSDLLEQFRRAQPAYAPPELPNYAFEAETMFASTRAPLRWIRKLLNPILKLFFNPNPLIQALNIQSRLNTMYGEREGRRESTRRAFDQLQYELMHNLVIETTRMSIEVKNLKMRVESLASRLEFNERRSRALESVVAYKPSAEAASEPTATLSAGRPVAVQDSAARPEQARSSGTGQPWTPREQQGRSDSGRGGAHSNQASAAGGPPAPPPPREPLTPHEPGRPIPIQPATGQGPSAVPTAGEGPGQRSRRRRRRRGRRGGAPAAAIMGGDTAAESPIAEFDSPESIAEGAADFESDAAPPGPPVEATSAPPMPDEHSTGPSAGTSTHAESEDRHEPQPLGEPQDHPKPAGGTTGPEQSDPQ